MTAQSLLTVADLDLMPEDGNRYEVIEGDLFMSRAPSILHQLVVTRFVKHVDNYLDHTPIGIVVAGPGLVFDEFNGVIPDVVFISNERRAQVATDQKLTGAPDLVIEVLSPGLENERRDREVKRRLYAKFGVQEYWIADLENRRIEIYRLRADVLELVTAHTANDDITTALLPGFRCAVARIFKF